MSCTVVNRCGCESPLAEGSSPLPLDFPEIGARSAHCRRNISSSFMNLAEGDGPRIKVAVGFCRCKAVINNLRAVFGLLKPPHCPVML
jgi:hypothetical protein